MDTTRTVALLALVLMAAGLAVATGAVVLDGEADTLADDRVALQPGADSSYAYLNDDEELRLDFTASNPELDADGEGLNANTVTGFGGVFTATYTADEIAHVWIEHDIDGVSFTSGGESVEGESNNVTLAPDGTASFGLTIDTRDGFTVGEVREEDFEFHAKVAEPEDASAPSSTSTTSDDDDGGTTVSVTSDSDAERGFSAINVEAGSTTTFDTGGMQLDGENVSLDQVNVTSEAGGDIEFDAAGSAGPFDDASELETDDSSSANAYFSLEYDFDPDDVSMEFGFSADADYLDGAESDADDVTLYRQGEDGWEELSATALDADVDGDRVHFTAATENLSVFAVATHNADLTVTDAELADASIEVGDSTTVDATVANNGGADGEATVTAMLDGEVVDESTVAVAAGETEPVSFELGPEDVGEYAVAVDDLDVGTLTVESADGAAGGNGSGDGDGADDESTEETETGTPTATEDTPVEEPGGFGLVELGGLVAALAVALLLVLLVRRMPRSDG